MSAIANLFRAKTIVRRAVYGMFALLLFFNLTFNQMSNTNEEDPGDYKNVILLIGDGMGFNHIRWMEQEYGIDSYMLNASDYVGASHTRSSSSAVTDSAAGGTALACATRTTNGAIGVFPQDQYGVFYVAQNLCEFAKNTGRLAGVVTTDENTGATPGSFSAHVFDRDEAEEITRQQIEESGLDLIWAAENGLVNEEYAEDYGWTFLDSMADFEAVEPGTRSFGAFKGELWNSTTGADSPSLSVMTEKAIDMLDDDEDGFFLMVEGAHIDKHSHNQNAEGMLPACREFDLAVKTAFDFAEENGDTLVVVSADHETGAISLESDGSYKYNSGSHSGVDVPLIVYGCDTFVQDDEAINNKEASRRMAMAMGAQGSEFPKAQLVDR